MHPERDVSDDPTNRTAIAVNQVGYSPAATKHAIVVADATDASTFAVVDTDGGDVVYEGALSAPIVDPDAGETVRHADFSDLDEVGTYVVRAGGAESHPFGINPDVYAPVLRDVGRLYTLKRSNTRIDDHRTGLDIAPGHPQDAAASLAAGDDYHDAGATLDVVGGWYDAGDYGKYVPPAAVTVAQHLLAYDLYPEAFDSGQYDAPEGVEMGAGDVPDVLAEARVELEWLESMQRPDGACYHKVAGASWPAMDVRPAEDDQPRYVFGHSTFGTAQYAGAMALAARVYADVDPAFADRALANAREAFDYLADTPDSVFRFDEGQDDGSGPYRKETDDAERFWAAAELLRTTGDMRYRDPLHDEHADGFDVPVTPVTWRNTRALGQWAYRSADAADPERAVALDDAFRAYADDLVASVAADGYRVALDTDDYHWASTKLALAKGCLLLFADEIDGDERYVEAAFDQLHYALGRTPTGYSYVTGAGANPPWNPHDRHVVSTGTSLPGMLVTGANANGDDDALAAYIERESPPPAKAYVDETASYAANEWAIDYTAPLLLVLARSRQ
ncbi:glycoside hydrolase family 9 protein [Halarchaeum sp. P4]|uniref:glycoside hydrolase family 9 protein n=1 Tax=Halarchaeum sp. P4 TaxID=3421639 RepID=UPI003EB78E22